MRAEASLAAGNRSLAQGILRRFSNCGHNVPRDIESGMRMTRRGRAYAAATGRDWATVLLAVVLSLFVVAGASFQKTNSSGWLTSSPGAMVASAIAVVLTATVLYLGLRLLFRRLDRMWDATLTRVRSAGVMPMRLALRRWLLPTWLVLLGGWLPWLLVHYPGNVDSDTITQMFEWLNYSQRSDHHPWFDTMVFGWFWDLGHALGSYNYGLFIMLLLQELATALGIAVALVYLGRLGLANRPRWFLTVAVAVFPVFFITPSVLSKDSFAGVFWTPFLVLFVEALRTRGRVLMRPWVAAGAILLTIPLILAQRPNLYLVILCVIALVVVAARGTRWRIAAGTLGVVLVTNVVWGMIVLPAWNIKPGSMTDVLSIPLQQTARTVKDHGSSLPASEKKAIDTVLRYDGLAKAYVPTRSDNVKGRWSSKATRAQQLEYFKVWFVEMFRYPGTYLAATFNNNYDYFAPLTRINFQSNLSLAHYIPFWHSRAFPTTTLTQISDVANSLHSPKRTLPAIASLNNETAAFMDSTLLLMSKALYASWIPLLALAMAIRRRSWFHALATLPVFVNLAILVAGPISLPRYEIPSIYGSVLLVGLTMLPVLWQPRRPGSAAPVAQAPAEVPSPADAPAAAAGA